LSTRALLMRPFLAIANETVVTPVSPRRRALEG